MMNRENLIIFDKRTNPPVRKPNRTEVKAQANRAYVIINEHFFHNELPPKNIKISKCQHVKERAAAFFYIANQEIYLSGFDFVDEWDTMGMINALFHEMVHAYDFIVLNTLDVRYIDGAQYHTELFKDTALAHGGVFMADGPDENYGYSDIELTRENCFFVMDAM